MHLNSNVWMSKKWSHFRLSIQKTKKYLQKLHKITFAAVVPGSDPRNLSLANTDSSAKYLIRNFVCLSSKNEIIY